MMNCFLYPYIFAARRYPQFCLANSWRPQEAKRFLSAGRPRTATSSESLRFSSHISNLSTSGGICSSSPPRVWNTTPHWCSLCLEPLNDWDNHRGKRDHICLEMFYDTLVYMERLWKPKDLWREVYENVLHCRMDQEDKKLITMLGLRKKNNRSSPLAPSSSTLTWQGPSMFNKFFRAFDGDEPGQRRRELHACLKFLQQKGVIHLDSSNLNQTSYYGQVVMFKELFPPLAKMFPKADAKEVSALTMMVYATYNNETVFDLCEMESLIPEALLRERTAITLPASSSDGEEDAGMQAYDSVSDDAEAVPYYLKGIFFRAVLGSLRWALEPDTLSPPPGVGVNEDEYGVLCVLAAYAARLLVAELIFYKISEYVARIEGVFRREEGLREASQHYEALLAKGGLGRESYHPSAGAKDHSASVGGGKGETQGHHGVIPHNSCWGMLQYSGGEDHIFNICSENSAFQRSGKSPRTRRG